MTILFDVIIDFFVVLLSVFLAFFVLSKSYHNETNQSFCLMTLCLAGWNLRHFLLHMASSQEIALNWVRTVLPIEVFIPAAFYHFVLAITSDHNRGRRILMYLAYLLSFVSMGFVMSGYVISGITCTPEYCFPVISGKEGYGLLITFGLLALYGVYLLYQRYRTTNSPKERTRLGYLLIALLFGGIFSLPGFLLVTQIMHIYPLMHIASAGFIIMVSYAILKHELMDVTVVIRKSLIYTLVTGFITSVFLINIILFSYMFQSVTGFSSLIPAIVAAIVVAFLFQPLREKIQLMIDKSFFRERYDQQQTIRDFNQRMLAILDLQELVDSISQVVSSSMHAKRTSILIYNETDKEYVSVTNEAAAGNEQKKLRIKEQHELICWLKIKLQPLSKNRILDYKAEPASTWNYEEIESGLQQLDAELCMPLILNKRLIGILSLDKKLSESPYSQQDIELISVLANEAAIAIENANLYHQVKEHMLKTVRALSAAVEAKDVYTNGHCERVMGYAVQMARRLELSKSQIEAIIFGATLHDIGKIGVGEDILLKPAALTEKEYDVIKTHPMTGAKILEAVDLPSEALEIVKYHHERYDGQGYPFGLKADSIPLVARILAVADAYEAMTSDRVYRPAMSGEDALQILVNESGQQFDPKMVELFILILEDKRVHKV